MVPSDSDSGRGADKSGQEIGQSGPADETRPDRITARLAVWRIFGIARDFSDRDDSERSHTIKRKVGPAAGDTLSVTVGDIPAHVIQSIREWRASIPLLLGALIGGERLSASDRECVVRDRVARVSVSDIQGNVPLWMTLELSRPLEVLGDSSLRVGWVREELNPKDLEAFGKDAGKFLDTAAARISGGTDCLPVEQVLFAEDRAYLLADGKFAVTTPNFTAGAVMAVVKSRGWAATVRPELEALVGSLPAQEASESLLTRPARWLWMALREQDDTLRRFLFAYCGLEVLANKVGSRLACSVLDGLELELAGVPMRELAWPTTSRDEDAPFRNIMFRFACMAVGLTRDTAHSDVTAFGQVLRSRNRLAHGSASELDSLPSTQAVQLLRHYLALVTKAQQPGGLLA